MSGLMHHVLRLGLTLSLMDRDVFVKNVAEFLEKYKNDPVQMEKIARGLFQYLEDLKARMDMQDAVQGAVSAADMPRSEEIQALTDAIEKLTRQMEQQNQTQS
jgi:DNA-binding transcriptional MerR regulator